MIVIRTCPILQSMSTGDLMFISICPYIKTAVGRKHGLQCSQNKHGNKRRNLVTIVQSQLEIPSDVRRTSLGSLYRRTSVLPRMYYVELRDVGVVTPSLADRSFDIRPCGPHKTITMQSEVSLCCIHAKDMLVGMTVNGFLCL